MTSSSPPSPPTYPSSCSGAADPDYTIGYAPGAVTVTNGLIDVAVSGSQTYGGSTPVFSGAADPPAGITVNTSGLSCTEVGTSTTISPALPTGNDTLVASSCSGTTLSGTDAAYYSLVLTSAVDDFTVTPAPVDVAVSGGQTYGSTTPTFSGRPPHRRASRCTAPA